MNRIEHTNILSIDNFRIKIDDVLGSDLEMSWSTHGDQGISRTGFLFAYAEHCYMEGIESEEYLYIGKFNLFGIGSDQMLNMLIEKIFPHTQGHMKALIVREGGERLEILKVNDGETEIKERGNE